MAVFSWFGLYVNRYVFFLMTWYTLLAGMLLPWCGYIFAFAIATLLRQDYKDSITISIETGIQNAGKLFITSLLLNSKNANIVT